MLAKKVTAGLPTNQPEPKSPVILSGAQRSRKICGCFSELLRIGQNTPGTHKNASYSCGMMSTQIAG
jgi:hypothetical protein